MKEELRPMFVIKSLIAIIILLIICYTTTVLCWVNSSYSYEIPESDIVNTNTNNIGGAE